VWVPKRAAREDDVPVATRFVSDTRATHYWDSAGVLVGAYRRVLGLDEDAWDVYMLYGPDARWDGVLPPAPEFWMHQLGSPPRSGVKAPYLDAEIFAAHSDTLLRRAPGGSDRSSS